jgi:hypothetical protein
MKFETRYKSAEAIANRTAWVSVGIIGEDIIIHRIVRDGETVGTVTVNTGTWMVQVESGDDTHTRSYASRMGTEKSGRILAQRLATYLGGDIA